MQVPAVPSSEIRPPPRGLVEKLARVAAPGEITLARIAEQVGGVADAKVFATQAMKHALLFRLRRGVYAAPALDACFLSWTFPRYFRELVCLGNALGGVGVPHAFACLAALQLGADYLPVAPLLVLPDGEAKNLVGMPAFRTSGVRAGRVDLRTAGSGLVLQVQAADRITAARVLAATGLPREVAAARQLIKGLRLSKGRAEEFNAMGVRTRRDVMAVSTPTIVVPPAWEKEKRRFAEQARLRELGQG